MSKNLLLASLFGAGAGLAGTASLEFILNFTNDRAAIIQSYLAKSPELTPQVFESAKKAAEQFSYTGLYYGVTEGVLASCLLLSGIYFACQKDN